jgi:hypothetical protein
VHNFIVDMKAASISEIKNSLKTVPSAQLTELCLRLARFKKENKELLTFLLFEADDIETYISGAKNDIEEAFSEVNWSNLYFAKKTIRKILRTVNKYSRYTGDKQDEADMLIHFCKTLKASGKPFHKNAALLKLYQSQLKKIATLINSMHEDLQYDYLQEVKALDL